MFALISVLITIKFCVYQHTVYMTSKHSKVPIKSAQYWNVWYNFELCFLKQDHIIQWLLNYILEAGPHYSVVAQLSFWRRTTLSRSCSECVLHSSVAKMFSGCLREDCVYWSTKWKIKILLAITYTFQGINLGLCLLVIDNLQWF